MLFFFLFTVHSSDSPLQHICAMKPQNSTKRPLQSRHRNVPGAAEGAAPVVPRMLRRMTKQSFMDVDLQYLMKLDPTTPDPFENSSPIFDDPPSLFRPLPASVMGVGAPGTGQWMSTEALRLQKEQEDLRVQYLQFLHQLHQTNPHGFLVHMNTFASEFPQEFEQLQAYIKYQENVANQQREEAQRQEQMRQYQFQLEQRLIQEQELQKYKDFQEMQLQQDQVLETQQLFQEWLLKRQQTRATSFRLNTNGKDDGLDLADVFTIALKNDSKMLDKVINMSAGDQGLSTLLTPAQQQEFARFAHQRKIQDMMAQEKKRQDMAAAGFSAFAFQPTSSSSLPSLPSLSSSSSSSPAATTAANLLNGSLWNSNGSGGSNSWLAGGLGSSSNPFAFQSKFQPSITNDQYLKMNRKR